MNYTTFLSANTPDISLISLTLQLALLRALARQELYYRKGDMNDALTMAVGFGAFWK